MCWPKTCTRSTMPASLCCVERFRHMRYSLAPLSMADLLATDGKESLDMRHVSSCFGKAHLQLEQAPCGAVARALGGRDFKPRYPGVVPGTGSTFGWTTEGGDVGCVQPKVGRTVKPQYHRQRSERKRVALTAWYNAEPTFQMLHVLIHCWGHQVLWNRSPFPPHLEQLDMLALRSWFLSKFCSRLRE